MIIMNINKKEILSRLPNLELSYENILHRKVFSDVCVAVPKGIKSLLWFTYYHNKNICFVIQLNRQKHISKIIPYIVGFNDELAYGTIIYGTFFIHNKVHSFSCENIHFYKGKKIEFFSYQKKINILQSLLKNDISQQLYTKQMLLIGSPIIKTTYEDIIKEAEQVNYPIYCIQYHKLNRCHPIGISLFKSTIIQQRYFQIKATIKDDVYNLYYYNQNTDTFIYHNIAMISNYKTSVMMNSLFREIKENTNLDLLEESDDEEEFENINEDKFVNLDKILVMKCKYNNIFHKWEPLELAENIDTNQIISFQTLSKIEK